MNCAGQQVTNKFLQKGLQYLTFFLLDQDNSLFFDKDDFNIQSLYDFVEEAQVNDDAVLIHSVYGKSRSLFVTAAYLMRKFHWSAKNAIDIVTFSRRIRMRASFEQQLYQYELVQPMITWTPELYEEEYVMRNTHFNRACHILQTDNMSQTPRKISFNVHHTIVESGTAGVYSPKHTELSRSASVPSIYSAARAGTAPASLRQDRDRSHPR